MTQSDEFQHQERRSFLSSVDQDRQIPVDQLSADEGMEKTMKMTSANQPKANMFFTAVTLVKGSIGSGIISLPYTFSLMGWALSIIMFIFFTIVNQYTCQLLLKAKNLSKHSTFNSIAYHISKFKFFRIFLSSISILNNLGGSVAMLTIFKGAGRKIILDLIDPSLADQFYCSESFVAIMGAVCIFPLILVKKMQSLRIASMAGVFAICIAMISMTIIFFGEMSDRKWSNNFQMRAFPSNTLSMISVIPNIMFALDFKASFYSIFKGLKNATDKRSNISTAFGIWFTTIVYIAFGVMGYCMAGQKTDGQIETNFLVMLNKDQIHPILYVSIYVGFLVCDLLCITLAFFIARNNTIAIIKMCLITTQTQSNARIQHQNTIQQIGSFIPSVSPDPKQITKKATIIFYLCTTILYIVFVFITILVQSLQSVFNFVGAVSSNSINVIFPLIFYVLLVSKKGKKKTFNYYISLVGIGIFIPLSVISVISLYI